MDKIHVFLGGSCNPTTWRKDEAIPTLESAGVTFYNPQVDDWSPELIQAESHAKAKAEILLFVIDGQTRAVASILEATEYICTGRKVILVIDEIADGTEVDGQKITGRELKDLNRARSYLADMANRHGTAVHKSVRDAISAIIG